MILSKVTSKGQTTIPKRIRDAMHLSVNDRISYEIRGDGVVLRPLGGSVFELRGSVKPSRRPENFNQIRNVVMDGISKRSAGRGRKQ